MERCQRVFPVARSRQRTVKSAPSPAVRNIFESVRTGEDLPASIARFQTMFFETPNSDGYGWSSAIPDPLGPRKRDQSSANMWTGRQIRRG